MQVVEAELQVAQGALQAEHIGGEADVFTNEPGAHSWQDEVAGRYP